MADFDAYQYPIINAQTRQRELVDDTALGDAILKGTHTFPADALIPVKNPEGEEVKYPAKDIQDALRNGYKIIGPRELAVKQFLSSNENLSAAAKVAAFQFLDEFAGGVPELVFDYSADPFAVAKKEALKKQHEVANAIGGVAGFGTSVLAGPIGLGANVAARTVTQPVTRAAARAMAARITAKAGNEVSEKVALSTAKKILANMAGYGAGGMAEGAMLSVPHAITEEYFGDHEAAGETMLWSTALGGILGSGGALTGDLLKLGRSGASKFYSWAEGKPLSPEEVSSKLMKTATGVPEDDILHILDPANQERMVRWNEDGSFEPVMPSIEEIKNGIDDTVGEITRRYEDSHQSYVKLERQAEKEYDRQLREIQKASAPQNLIDHFNGKLDEMKAQLWDGKGEFDDLLNDMVDLVARKTPEGELKDSRIFVPFSKVDQRIGELERKLQGYSPLIGSDPGLTVDRGAVAALNEIERIKQVIDNYKLKKAAVFSDQAVPGIDIYYARDLARGLDRSADWGIRAGEFDSKVSQSIKEITYLLRQDVRDSLQAYAGSAVKSSLDSVSEETLKNSGRRALEVWDKQIDTAKTLDRARDFFTSKKSSDAALRKLTKEGIDKDEIWQVIGDIERVTGQSVREELDAWLKHKDILKLAQENPEAARLQLVPKLHADVEDAKKIFEKEADRYQRFRGWNVDRTQSVIRNQGFKSASIENRRRLEELSSIRDELFGSTEGYQSIKFPEAIRDRQVWDSFDVGRTQGSKMTNMYSDIGKFLGGTIGTLFGGFGVGTLVGGATGAVAGGVADNYGGKVLRHFLLNGNNYRGVLYIEKAMKLAAKSLDSVSSAIENIAKRDSAGKIGLATRQAGIRFFVKGSIEDDSRTARLENFEKFSEAIHKIVSNPNGLAAQATQLGGLLKKNGAKKSGDMFNMKLIKALEYIEKTMPKAPRPTNPFNGKSNWKPTDWELDEFDDRIQIIVNPFSAVDRLKDQTLSYAHVETLKEIYPKIHDAIRQRVIDRMQKGDLELPRSSAIKLSLLLDMAVDESLEPEAILANQRIYEAKDETQEEENPRGSSKMQNFFRSQAERQEMA